VEGVATLSGTGGYLTGIAKSIAACPCPSAGGRDPQFHPFPRKACLARPTTCPVSGEDGCERAGGKGMGNRGICRGDINEPHWSGSSAYPDPLTVAGVFVM